ncbi:LysR family transcriptional regulator [Dongia deserti]|uniref:LysR family transcriptional regulator n=1 Tax=Dongia deserti TaxID=2268030 RepID=UPI000E65143D|nr:LysR family transcriptional regulator [Dongia deserti]
MENWDGWHTLLTVVETGTLSGAAAQLHIDATTIGRRLSRLEARTGRRLLVRRGGRLEPTATCRALLPRLEEAAQQIDSARTLAAGEGAKAPRRPVRITSLAFLCDHLLAPQIETLAAARQPIELLAEDKNLNLARREADLALRLGPPQGSRRGARQVGWVRYAIYAAIDRDPGKLPWAALDAALAPLPEVRYVEAQAKDGGIQFRASKLETLAVMAAAGAARVVLPHLMGDRHPRLQRVGDLSVLKRPLWLISGTDKAQSPHAAAVARRIEQIAKAALKS